MFRTFMTAETRPKAVALFFVVLGGILAKWFWAIGWDYLKAPEAGLAFGSLQMLLVRVILALIAAVLTFIPAYNKIGQTTGESWLPYFLAFQSGFFWEAALGDVV